MSTPQARTGNPVFDFKSGFRAAAQSVQRVLFQSGLLMIAAGAAARFVALENTTLKRTLAAAPALGLVLVMLSAAWGYYWRSKLRGDFQREFSVK